MSKKQEESKGQGEKKHAENSAESQEAEKKVLTYLGQHGSIENSADFAGVKKEILDPVLLSLSAVEYIKLEVLEKKIIELTDEG